MNAFDKVIGYEPIKNELLQICDMIRNREVYYALGAKMPRGVLLYGEPGLGKTLMAECFIDECGLKAYILRRNKGADRFVDAITDIFQKAKDNAPSIVLLDDLDKYANGDDAHRDAKEYVAVQAGIDDVKDADVFVFATVNDYCKLPRSLRRSGRFDRKIEILCPSSEDASEIIRHYLKDKKVSEDIDPIDIAMMIQNNSCAELETVLNEAAIRAAFLRKESITMDDVIYAVLRMEYDTPDSFEKPSEDQLRRVALHEAGHLVICEVLCPGSIGMASLYSLGKDSACGFVRRCRNLEKDPDYILAALGGKAAVDLYYADSFDDGWKSDLCKAAGQIKEELFRKGSGGMGLLDLEMESESLNARREAVVFAELERYLFKAKDILLKNRDFLEQVADALMEKETLLYSDIKQLRESVPVTVAAV